MAGSHYIVINPICGSGKGRKDWPRVADLLSRAGLAFEHVFTGREGHARDLVRDALERGFRNILVSGGDGTVNEAVNGIFGQQKAAPGEVTMGLIPVGTGNDWMRTMSMPGEYDQAVAAICNRKIVCQDVGLATYYHQGEQKRRYFANVAGMGYDAFVARRTNESKKKKFGKSLFYLLNLFSCLLEYKSTDVTITIDGQSRTDRVFSLNVGICRYNGGGMMQVPHAVPDDGQFGITVIRHMGVVEIIRNVKNLYDGSFVNHPKVDT